MRVKTLLRNVLGLCRAVVICGWELHDGERPASRCGCAPRRAVRVAAGGAGRPSASAILQEALNDWFQKKGLPPVA